MTTPPGVGVGVGVGDERSSNVSAGRENLPGRTHGRWRTVGIALAVGLAVLVVVVYVRQRATGRQREYQDAMVQALGKLVTAQEGFFYDSVRYATSLRAFPHLGTAAGVRLAIDSAGARTWWGTATHTAVTGQRCVVWVGTPPRGLPADVRAPENEGKPICLGVSSTGTH